MLLYALKFTFAYYNPHFRGCLYIYLNFHFLECFFNFFTHLLNYNFQFELNFVSIPLLPLADTTLNSLTAEEPAVIRTKA